MGNATTWTYDALDRVTREENKLGAARTFVYDAVSNLTRCTERLDRVIEYDYDALQRQASVPFEADSVRSACPIVAGEAMLGLLLARKTPVCRNVLGSPADL